MLNRFFTEVPKQFKGGRTDLTKYGTGATGYIETHKKRESPPYTIQLKRITQLNLNTNHVIF